ncbi:helix-turn-helix domain-containing protein [Pseudomonas aeruginosa]|uniref:helix-turn-helix domain-containing protein n=3 Tax=Pseudomonas aeruginosa TaxID=287 RepID=UPI0005C7BA17|nr:helix-turn-helix transcriptional regulator [Pseudomonas aeruginosa]AKG00189.1 XRE family transcriptional regulator [Pseudomonas aeruginosa]EIU3313471.1 helix-turn-helix transcriptional regulator [Pseudomonas aeruginosa]EIU6860180.1 helix-turn-helix transcriptional regulator [Pseudomonas aeruginosa]EIU6969389.1 helix-turn-helix transcriptional regulator [Pseudomonas aeruginosa]EIU6977649.1 helix-turn-helix transcriptional regulator [Pseudomonas aeruginosa]
MSSPSLRRQFGHRIRELRLASGLNQEAFADKCGFARTYMSRIETGGANPSLDAIKTLADALGVELAELFRGLQQQTTIQPRRATPPQ